MTPTTVSLYSKIVARFEQPSKMQLISSIVTLGSLASTAIAVSEVGFEFPDSVPMSKRQTDGPSYECHADCGMSI